MNTKKLAYLSGEGVIRRLIFNDPDKRNVMTVAMGDAVGEVVTQVNADPSVRVLIVEGKGSAFSAGGDLTMIENHTKESPEHNQKAMVEFYKRYLRIMDVKVPVIAKIHGPAVGGGACFASACDIRIASEEAKIGFVFVNLGIHPGMGSTYFLPRLVGLSRASELLLTGRVIDGKEAERIGFVSRCVPKESLETAVLETARAIADAAPIAVSHLKRNLQSAPTVTLEDAFEAESAAQAVCYGSEDLLEGVRAIREKRKPLFSGK